MYISRLVKSEPGHKLAWNASHIGFLLLLVVVVVGNELDKVLAQSTAGVGGRVVGAGSEGELEGGGIGGGLGG